MRDAQGGRAAPLYTGLRVPRPFQVVDADRQGDTLRLFVKHREINERTVTFPPIGLRTGGGGALKVLECSVNELARDEDGDGTWFLVVLVPAVAVAGDTLPFTPELGLGLVLALGPLSAVLAGVSAVAEERAHRTQWLGAATLPGAVAWRTKVGVAWMLAVVGGGLAPCGLLALGPAPSAVSAWFTLGWCLLALLGATVGLATASTGSGEGTPSMRAFVMTLGGRGGVLGDALCQLRTRRLSGCEWSRPAAPARAT